MIKKRYDRLPIGQRVYATTGIDVPTTFNDLGDRVRLDKGEIVDHLANGAFVVKFDNYSRTWDFNASVAWRFKAIN